VGKKKRLLRRAKRKERKAAKKTAKAEKALKKGKTKKAERKLAKAAKKTAKAEELREKAALAKGVLCNLHSLNTAGGCLMTVKWNYEGGDQTPRYDHHEISIASSSPFRQQGMAVRDIDASQFEWTTPNYIPNIRYVVKVYGAKDSSGSITELIGRCIAKKIK
jgi:hypothetical protein